MITKETVKCSHKTLTNGKFCNKCGKKLNIFERLFCKKEQLADDATLLFCKNCHARYTYAHNFCHNCGHKIERTNVNRDNTTVSLKKIHGINLASCTNGHFFDRNTYQTCPHCAASVATPKIEPEVKPDPIQNEPIIENNIEAPRPDECFRITKELSENELSRVAEETFKIKVQLENGESIDLELKGCQSEYNAILKLRELGVLSKTQSYKFSNWPPLGRRHCSNSVLVCQLDPNTTYRIEPLIIDIDIDIDRYRYRYRDRDRDRDDIRELYGCPNPSSINYSHRLAMVQIEVVDYGKL